MSGYIKSPIRWSGSKSRILDKVIDSIGDVAGRNFVEPFVGSATVALNVANVGRLILNDLNADLITTHKQMRDNIDDLCLEVDKLLLNGRKDFNDLKAVYNNTFIEVPLVKRAALFIYLNRTAFNGLYRTNLSGKFNVPVGCGNIMDPTHLMHQFSELMINAEFTSDDFENCIDCCETNNVIYVDSPYPPANASGTDYRYTKGGFNLEDHIRLAESVKRAANRGNRVIVSNSCTPLTAELYSDADSITHLYARRSISGKGKARGDAKELVAVYNGNQK